MLTNRRSRLKPNIYDCPKCGGETVTRHVDEGVAPFLLGCKATPGCHGMARSRFYEVPAETEDRSTHEWFKPSKQEYRKLSRAMKEHVDLGGLDLREIKRKEES